jgi:hypothetical protein
MRYLKTYKIFETSHEEIMNSYYGSNVMEECDSIIDDIKDMLLELKDIGLFITVGYTPMTLSYRDKTPKIMAEVQGDSLLCSYNEDDIDSAFERIKEYTSSKGYVTGFGTWERELLPFPATAGNGKNISVYQMLIQK